MSAVFRGLAWGEPKTGTSSDRRFYKSTEVPCLVLAAQCHSRILGFYNSALAQKPFKIRPRKAGLWLPGPGTRPVLLWRSRRLQPRVGRPGVEPVLAPSGCPGREGKQWKGRDDERGICINPPALRGTPDPPLPNLPFRPLIYSTGFCRVAILFCFGHNVDHAACKEEGAELVHRSGRSRRLDLTRSKLKLFARTNCVRWPVELVSWIGFPKKPCRTG